MKNAWRTDGIFVALLPELGTLEAIWLVTSYCGNVYSGYTTMKYEKPWINEGLHSPINIIQPTNTTWEKHLQMVDVLPCKLTKGSQHTIPGCSKQFQTSMVLKWMPKIKGTLADMRSRKVILLLFIDVCEPCPLEETAESPTHLAFVWF